MKIAIVGSRDFNDFALLKMEVVDFIIKENLDKTPIVIVSGGARGADALAERLAEEMNWDKQIFLAQWSLHGKRAGFLRNKEIVENSDALIAFRINQSKGTTHSIRLAKEKNIKVKVLDFYGKNGQIVKG